MSCLKSVFKKSAVDMKKYCWAGVGTIIYSYINFIAAILYVARCILSIGWLLLAFIVQGFTGGYYVSSYDVYHCLIMNVSAAVLFLFAALLFFGMYKNKPNYVLAYFIFGVLVDIVLMAIAAGFHYIPTHVHMEKGMHDDLVDIQYPVRNAFIGISSVYTSILVMIWCHIVFDDTLPDDGKARKLSSDLNKSDYRID